MTDLLAPVEHPAPGEPSPVLELRRRTRDLHEQTEATFPLLRADLDLEGYANALRGLLAVHEPLEARIAAVLAKAERSEPAEVVAALGDLGWRERRRSPLLRHDLRQLGCDPDQPGVPGPELPSVAAAIGALYVLEGSTLGAAILAEHVRAHLGAGTPRSYLVGAGTGTARRWASFRRVANRILAASGLDEAVDAARATFAAMEAIG